MHKPKRREVKRFIHVDTTHFDPPDISSYTVNFGNNGNIPVQDYNNVIKLKFKIIQFQEEIEAKYVQLKIKNIDGDIDSTSSVQNASTICYLDATKKNKPIVDFAGGIYNFDTMLSKLTKLEIQIFDESGNLITSNNDHSFVIEITYIEGNLY